MNLRTRRCRWSIIASARDANNLGITALDVRANLMTPRNAPSMWSVANFLTNAMESDLELNWTASGGKPSPSRSGRANFRRRFSLRHKRMTGFSQWHLTVQMISRGHPGFGRQPLPHPVKVLPGFARATGSSKKPCGGFTSSLPSPRT